MADTGCTCGTKFRDAEDYRDHLPCPGTQSQQLKQALVDITDSMSRWQDIQAETGLPDDRCKEIWKLAGRTVE